MKEDENTLSAWQAGTLNESAHKYLSIFSLSWFLFMFFVAMEYGQFLVPSLIAVCCAIYYWNERTKLGEQYLRDNK